MNSYSRKRKTVLIVDCGEGALDAPSAFRFLDKEACRGGPQPAIADDDMLVNFFDCAPRSPMRP
jgi:hypothetical protein